MPLVAHSLASSSCARRFNLTFHHLDSSRFVVSPSDVRHHRTTPVGELRRRPFRHARSQLRRKTNKSNVKSPTSSTEAAATAVDLDCFRLIFVAVDVAIVAFHLCRGYVDLQRLQRCRCRCKDAADGEQYTLRNGDLTTTADPGDDGVGLGRLLPPPPPPTSEDAAPAVCGDAVTATKTANDYTAVHGPESDVTARRQPPSADVLQRRRRRRRRSCVVARTTLTLVGRIVRSRSLLSLLACAFIVAVTHCVVRTCSRLAVSHLPAVPGDALASALGTAVRFRTAAANAHLVEDMRRLDSAVLHLSSSSTTQDLLNLLSIVHYFRQGRAPLTFAIQRITPSTVAYADISDGWLIGWWLVGLCLTAFSAQIGYIMPR